MVKSKRIRIIIGEFVIIIAILLEIVLFSWLSPFFFTTDNILNATLQTSITAIIAAGVTFVILTAGIDLSVGAMVAFSGVIATSSLKLNLPFIASTPLAIAVGLGIGAPSGAFLGAMLIGILGKGLNLLNVGSYVQMVVRGVGILLAVLIDQMRIQ